eukprot:scaffold94318_cov20-Tisochrysis_lutea.AAC.4
MCASIVPHFSIEGMDDVHHEARGGCLKWAASPVSMTFPATSLIAFTTADAQVEKLEARCAALSPMASRLPVLRAQHETLVASCLEVEGLEARQAELKQ